MRETGQAVAIGSNGGTGGTGIEWINLDGQFLPFDSAWHQFSFNFGSDPVTSFTGDGVLTGTRGTLEHIRFLNAGGITDNITIYVDNVVHTVTGTPTTLTGFESSEPPAPAVGQPSVMFREPEFSGSTQSFIQPGSTSAVTDVQAHSGTQSLRLNWTFVNGVTSNWVRTRRSTRRLIPTPRSTTPPEIRSRSGSAPSRSPPAAPDRARRRQLGRSGQLGHRRRPQRLQRCRQLPERHHGRRDDLGQQRHPRQHCSPQEPLRLHVVGPSILTFSAPAESSMNINVEQGSHTFAGPITLDSNSGTFGVMNFNVTAAADVLHITGDITVNNSVPLTVFKTGGPRRTEEARIACRSAHRADEPGVTGGTLKLTAGGGRTKVNDLFIVGGNTPTAKLDITDNPVVVDYVAPNPSPLATIQAQIKAAYNGGRERLDRARHHHQHW